MSDNETQLSNLGLIFCLSFIITSEWSVFLSVISDEGGHKKHTVLNMKFNTKSSCNLISLVHQHELTYFVVSI